MNVNNNDVPTFLKISLFPNQKILSLDHKKGFIMDAKIQVESDKAQFEMNLLVTANITLKNMVIYPNIQKVEVTNARNLGSFEN